MLSAIYLLVGCSQQSRAPITVNTEVDSVRAFHSKTLFKDLVEGFELDYKPVGRDIKVAIFDDMIEITSPGKLLPSIDFDELEARQSDIRNKVIAIPGAVYQ